MLQTSMPVRMSAECLRNACTNAFTRLSGCCWNACKNFSNAAEMLSECFGDACRMLADSVCENDRRVLQEFWQNVALLLPHSLIACQNAVGMFVECYPNTGMPLAECNQNPELQLRAHSAPFIWVHSGGACDFFSTRSPYLISMLF